jgi:hypothetical protein
LHTAYFAVIIDIKRNIFKKKKLVKEVEDDLQTISRSRVSFLISWPKKCLALPKAASGAQFDCRPQCDLASTMRLGWPNAHLRTQRGVPRILHLVGHNMCCHVACA